MYECFRLADKEKEYVVPLPYGLDLDIVNKVEIRGREFVPVVRCGECKFKGEHLNCSYCTFCGERKFPDDDWFCADGKRR